MQGDKKKLLELLEAIQKVKVLVIGDLMLDRYIWGSVERISPEAPVPVVAVTRTEDRLGGAGNAVRNLLELNVDVKVAGVLGSDMEGEAVRALLHERGADSIGVITTEDRPTSIKTRVIAQAQQVVRIDREDVSAHTTDVSSALAQKVSELIPKVDAIVVSDYGKGSINAIVWQAFENARREGLILNNNRPLVVDPHPASYDLYRGITTATPNRKEAEAAAGMLIKNYDDAFEAAQKIIKRWDVERMLITLGELGLSIVPGDANDPVSFPTVAQEVYDVSGAGDTVIALYTAGIAAGGNPELAAELANRAAGIVVSEFGTVPIKLDKLRKTLEAL